MASSNKRLFIGNIAETADEYVLVQFLSKHGKITKFDYLFHKAGPRKGKPRGYAFVEYGTDEEALKTMLELNDKVLQGRRISVKRANEAPEQSSSGNTGPGAWRNNGSTGRSTLSLLKGKKPESRESKISALEAKLAVIEAQKEQASFREGSASADSPVPSARPKEAHPRPSLPDNLPTKPSASVIATGEKLEMEAIEEQQRTGAHRSHQPAKEKPKATLASLGSSFRRD